MMTLRRISASYLASALDAQAAAPMQLTQTCFQEVDDGMCVGFCLFGWGFWVCFGFLSLKTCCIGYFSKWCFRVFFCRITPAVLSAYTVLDFSIIYMKTNLELNPKRQLILI